MRNQAKEIRAQMREEAISTFANERNGGAILSFASSGREEVKRVRKGEGVKPKPHRELRGLLASMSKTELRIPNPKIMAAVKRGDEDDGREAADDEEDERARDDEGQTATTVRTTTKGLCDGDGIRHELDREQLKLRTPPPKPTKSNPHFQISSNNTKSPKLALQSPTNKAVIASTVKTSIWRAPCKQ
ncbi:hypothetical protein Scep_019749 [Stephania cephalantha]|uniref:Uncharacterized protein n=1 Tax=Stephania cephalantha TaxID=152367 RepID=A0AAP0IBR3_9MAGN